MYEELIKSLREDHGKQYFARDMEAADVIESLEKENRFLKMMQQQMVDKIPMDDIGRMAYAALKGVKP